MHRSRRAIAASVSVSMALATSVAVAHADDTSPSALYVNNAATASCSDTASGAGTAATPFCTIQAAADAAVPGDTVDIATGTYRGAVDVKSVGTAAAPITFQATGGRVIIAETIGETGPVLTFDGAEYVDFEGAEGTGPSEAHQLLIDSVLVNGSSHIGLDSVGSESIGTSASGNNAVEVDGTSSNVTISRSLIEGDLGGVLVDSGSSGDVISTNEIISHAFGIVVNGASDTAITSNTVTTAAPSNEQIGVFSGSTGTSIENNIVAYPTEKIVSSPAAIAVDASSAAGTTSDYNVVWPAPGYTADDLESAYSWAGADYASQSAFTAATGQGEHDLVTDPKLNGTLVATTTVGAPQIDSANSAAPGMLPTDMYGAPCTVDPVVPISGAGSPAYCERGAVQQAYATSVTAATAPVNALSVSLNSSMSQTYEGDAVSAMPTPAVSYVVAWGDGTTSTVQGSATTTATTSSHSYAKAGSYTITDTADLTDGTTTTTTTSFTTTGSAYTAENPTRILDTRNGTGAPEAKVPVNGSITVKVAGVGSIPADATAVALNLTVTNATGNGYLSVDDPSISNLNYGAGQTAANSVIAPVQNGSITIYNSGKSGSADVVADVSGYFAQSTGSGYAATTLNRILDTRNGTGAPKAKVPANSGIPVTIAGADSIPAGVTAVAVHVTVVDTTGNGWIAAEPDGAGTPTTSSLNYGKGQIVSNTVIVPVAADGKIELYNGGGTTSVDLLADVSGYFSATAPDAYMPINPERVWDTRQMPGSTIPANATAAAWLEGDDGDLAQSPFPPNATLVANTTVTDAKGNGYLTVYPFGTGRPGVSNLNYAAGQTLAGLGFLSTTGDQQEVAVYNDSTGSVDVIFDVFGYFANS